MADTNAYAPTTSQESAVEKIVGSKPSAFKRRIERSKREKREFTSDWQNNVDRRRGKPTATDSDDNRQRVPVDWSHTKAKISALFSQLPRVICTAEANDYKPAAHIFGKHLNKRLKKGGIEATMFEVLPDVINKSGFGAAMVRFEATMDVREVPVVADADLSLMDTIAIRMGFKQREMTEQEYTVDRRFVVGRVSPDDLLWDADEFDGSDFDTSPWIGHSGRMTPAEAQREFKLTDEQLEKAIGDTREGMDKPEKEYEGTTKPEGDVVCYDEIFYWRYLFHEDEKYFKAIQRMVFIDGLGNEPIVNEPWKGQRFDEELGSYLGSCRFPIQVLTFNYLSDEPIPPSDSSMMRPQVDELEKSRFQMALNRDHSRPIRWVNIDRTDADIWTALMNGDWQHFIPTQGPGDKVVGEVARAAYPRDNMEHDRVIKQDLMETGGVGQNQLGSLASGERSAAEAKITQGHFSTRTSQERARTVSFFLGLADVMAGLMCLYDDFELPETKDMEALEMWDRTRINHELVFSTRGDSSVLLDAGQRFDRLERFLNIAGKSGYFDPVDTLREMAELSDIDPESIQPPQPKGPEKPNVSYRFSGEDMMNPIAVAVMAKTDMAPSREDVMAAKMIIASAAMTPGVDPQPPFDPSLGVEPGSNAMRDDRPDWQIVDRINSRRDASQK